MWRRVCSVRLCGLCMFICTLRLTSLSGVVSGRGVDRRCGGWQRKAEQSQWKNGSKKTKNKKTKDSVKDTTKQREVFGSR